jgi:hypothetical protein
MIQVVFVFCFGMGIQEHGRNSMFKERYTPDISAEGIWCMRLSLKHVCYALKRRLEVLITTVVYRLDK